MIELVVARYTEDLAWLRNIPPQSRSDSQDCGTAKGRASADFALFLPKQWNLPGVRLYNIIGIGSLSEQ